jgi:hypothetical protein
VQEIKLKEKKIIEEKENKNSKLSSMKRKWNMKGIYSKV